MNTIRSNSKSQLGCLFVLVCFSALLAFTAYPDPLWGFGAAFGLLALFSIFRPVGWFLPCTIAGVYLGVFVLDSPVKGGTIESQMKETIGCILFGAIVGFVFGACIDARQRTRSGRTAGRCAATTDEQSDGLGAMDSE